MTTFALALELVVRSDVGDVPADLEDRLDQVGEELDGLSNVTDADYSASLSEGVVTFTGFVDAEDLVDAHQLFATAVRTAIHAAGGSTAGWPTFTDRSMGAHVADEAPDTGLVDA